MGKGKTSTLKSSVCGLQKNCFFAGTRPFGDYSYSNHSLTSQLCHPSTRQTSRKISRTKVGEFTVKHRVIVVLKESLQFLVEHAPDDGCPGSELWAASCWVAHGSANRSNSSVSTSFSWPSLDFKYLLISQQNYRTYWKITRLHR